MAYLVSLVLDEFLNSVRNGKIAFFIHKTNVTWKMSSKHSALVVFVVCFTPSSTKTSLYHHGQLTYSHFSWRSQAQLQC